MDLKRIILLVILGVVLSGISVITALTGWAVVTPMIIITVLVAVVVILLVRDLKRWIESLVDRIAAGDSKHREEIARISASLESVKATVARIEERLDSAGK
jgi:predicted PurR-regulated permease PerM